MNFCAGAIMYRRFFSLALAALTGLSILTSAFAGEDDSMARKLLNSQGCKACHSLEGHGGTAARSFEEIRDNLSAMDIRLQLVNQAGQHGNARIPDFSHLSKDELEALIQFIKPEL
jgi:hypothetical protein